MKNPFSCIILVAIVLISLPNAGFCFSGRVSNDSIPCKDTAAARILLPADGAVGEISTGQFNQGYTVSADDLLQGKVAGLRITKEGGSLGGFSMQLRGRASLLNNNTPLIVVDGLPLSGNNLDYGVANPLFFLNPSDIASVTVLKDAVATSAWGGRGAYGVILINTKRAEKNTRFSFDFSSDVSLSGNPVLYDVLAAATFRSLVSQRYSEQPGVISLMGEGNTNWQQEIYRNAFSSRHNIAISGSPMSIPVRASFGITENQGAMHTDRFGRTGGQLRITPSLLDDHLSMDINLRALQANHQVPWSGNVRAAISFDPTQQVMDQGNNLGNYFAWLNSQMMPQSIAPGNPVARLYQENNRVDVNRYIAQAGINYSMHFLPALKASLRYSYDSNESHDSKWVSDIAAWSYNIGGYQSNNSLELTNELSEFFLSYDSPLPLLNGNINVVAGYSSQSFKKEGSLIESNIPGNAAGVNYYIYEGNYTDELYHRALFGLIQYSINDRYLFNVTLNRSSFSGFSETEQVKVFPSVSFAWNIHEEAFMNNVSMVESMKWRLGYGKSGQTQFNTEEFSLIDPKLGYPEHVTLNTGIDFVFEGNRLSGNIDYYSSKTSNMHSLIPAPAGSNFGIISLINLGDMKSSGLEIELNLMALKTPNLRWQAGVNASWSRSVIDMLSYGGESHPGITFAEVSRHSPGQEPFSFFLFQQVYDVQGNPIEGEYVDHNNDGVISYDEDMIFFPGPDPDLLMGLSSFVQYKQWHMGFSGRLSIGNNVYNDIENYSAMHNPAGPHLGNITTQSSLRGFEYNQHLSSHFVENASFFRLDHLSMGYDFRSILKGRASLELSATVHNLVLLTSYSGPDPEVPMGIDYGYYPRPRLFVMGIKLKH